MFLKFTKLFIFITLALLLAGCSNRGRMLRGVKPVADSEVAVIEMENPAFGKITIELYSNIAPEMVKRFKELAREGFYNGTTFHRINPAVIQGGDPLSKDDNPDNDGTGSSPKPNVQAEFSDIPYDTGIVGAARGQNVNSANSQFFITLKRTAEFDENYTIFGKVIDGMNNARTIAAAPRDRERPLEPIRIKSVTIQTKQ
jgi:peptidyl-prolyl cis-trans isomerase B (cyclophilin B)